MHTPASFCFLRTLFFFAFTFGSLPGLHAAQEKVDEDAPLVVSGGEFMHGGKTETASLKNVIALLQQRYPRANITMVGVEELRVGNVTVQWRDHGLPNNIGPRIPASLHGVLAALAEATNRGFEVEPFSENDFLLRRPGVPPESSKPTVRVFNLRGLGGRQAVVAAELQQAIRMAQAERAVLAKRFGAGSPRVMDQDVHIETLEAQEAVSRQSPPNQEKLFKDIQEAVGLALAQTAPGEKTPDFKYHAGTNLLIVTGSEVAVDTTRMVIDALVKNP